MPELSATDKLNTLLAAEYESLIPRLEQADPYVNWSSVDDRAVVDRLLADSRRHQRELVELIYKLRGVPIPLRLSSRTANVHYVKLEYLMPSVIASLRLLVQMYESIGSTGESEADALVSRHLDNYKRHLATLEKMHSNLLPTS